MAILNGGRDGCLIRNGGQEVALRVADFPGIEVDAQTESRLQGVLGTALGRVVSIHIFTRSPLSFAVRTDPAGASPPADWWSRRLPRLT